MRRSIIALLLFCVPAFAIGVTNEYSGQPVYSGMVLTTVPSSGLITGLIGWWKMDDSGTNAVDSSGNNHTGSVVGTGATWGTGIIDGAIVLNGSGNGVSIPAINFGTTFSVACWFNRTAATSVYDRIVETDYASCFFLGANLDGTAIYWIINNPALGTCTGGTITNGVWQHACGTFDGSKGILYFNGVSVATNTFDAPASTPITTAIGYDKNTSSHFSGKLDDVRIYSRALSATEVAELATAPCLSPTNIVGPVSAVVTNGNPTNFTALFSGTAQLTYKWLTNTVEVTDNTALIWGSTTTNLIFTNVVAGWSNLAVACVCSNSCGSVTGAVATLTVEPIVGVGVNNNYLSNYWKLNESSPESNALLADSVGSCTLETFASDGLWPQSVAGIVGNALYGNDSHSSYATTNMAMVTANGDWSVTGWFYPVHTNDVYAILGKGVSSDRQLLLRIESTSALTAYCSSDGTSWDKSVASTAQLATGSWFFFAVTHNSSAETLNLYVGNTSSMLATNTTGSLGALNAGSDQNIYLMSSLGGANNWNGYVDEVGVWATALTAAQVAAEWNGGAGTTHP